MAGNGRVDYYTGTHIEPDEGCRYALNVLDRTSMTCEECPFPFCVVHESIIMRRDLNEHYAKVMRSLGRSFDEIAKTLGVNIRSAYRFVNTEYECAWCNLVHSVNAVCRSDAYTVIKRQERGVEKLIIVLSKHRDPNTQDRVAVKDFLEYVFPRSLSSIESRNGGHGYWIMNSVKADEAKRFQVMCNALDKYTMSLSRSSECLQTVRL